MFATRTMAALLAAVCLALTARAAPSLSFGLPLPGPLAGLAGRVPKTPQEDLKRYSGHRVRPDSMRMVYFHDQTVATVELGPEKLLLGCELIEVYEPDQVLKVLGELSVTARPVGITLREMLTLMDQCKEVEEIQALTEHEEGRKNSTSQQNATLRDIISSNPFSLLSGVIPGTKWCGTGDIAKDYFDLGAESLVDSCCRAHDLCPVKIRAYSKRYNLTNNSIYTKSHCKCDDNLFYCLKNNDSPIANIMGNIYFNLVQVPCLEDSRTGRKFRNANNSF